MARRADVPGVGPDLLLTRPTGGCPSCGASVRGEATFCTLCFHDLRPAPVPASVAALQETDPLTAPLWQVGGAAAPGAPDVGPASADGAGASTTWPCTTCGADNNLSADICSACGAGFLAVLRDKDGPALVLPLVGDLGAMSRSGRAGVALGLVLLVCLLVTLTGVLL